MSDSWTPEKQPEIRRPTAQEVREYLPKLLDRSEFNVSERNRRFLSYVVEETLAGRSERIKAYNIALAAFNRGEDFDPLADPIVRIEAGRLRQGLKHYYLTAGKTDAIRIDVPKGAYLATFAFADNASLEAAADAGHGEKESPAATGRRWAKIIVVCMLVLTSGLSAFGLWTYGSESMARGNDPVAPSIVILPFENASGDPRATVVARGFTYELVAALTKSGGLSVFGAAADADSRNRAAEPIEGTYHYALFGSTQIDGATVRTIAFLTDHRSGRVLKSWIFECGFNTRRYLDCQRGIAAQISSAVAHLTGESVTAAGAQRPICRPPSRHTASQPPQPSASQEGPANCA